MKNEKLSDFEQLFRIASMVVEELASLQDIQETTLKEIEIDDHGNCIYLTINGGLTTEGIDNVAGVFGDPYPIVRATEKGIVLSIVPEDKNGKFDWICFEHNLTLRTEYGLGEE